MLAPTTGSPIDDVEFLARSDHRVTALVALAERPRSRAELQELTGVSRSTIGRTLHAFDARGWIGRDGHQFDATPLGAFVATGMEELIGRLETERALRDVWRWLPPAESGFTVEMGDGAVVTGAESDDPYAPVNRFASLLEATDRFRFVGIDLGLLEPCRDELAGRIVDGMRAEIVDPPSAASHVLETYGDHCAGPLESGNLTVRVHDGLPAYGIAIFDDRIAVSGNDPDGGTVRVLLDTDDSDAREWAADAFDAYRREARPLGLESIAD